MSCPSIIQTVNGNINVAANGAIPCGNILRRYGRALDLSGSDIVAGYYLVITSITLTPEAAGLVGAQLFVNGAPVPGANASTTGAAATTDNIFINTTVRIMGNCCQNNCVPISLQLVTADGVTTGATVNNLSATVAKL